MKEIMMEVETSVVDVEEDIGQCGGKQEVMGEFGEYSVYLYIRSILMTHCL